MMKESNNPKRMRPPPDRMGSQSSQAAETTDATTDLTTLKRPLHEYVATVSERTEVRRGVPLPMGTHEYGRGVNFAFFSRHASRVRLELFDHPHDAMTAKGIDLDPARHRTGDVWHIWVEGIQPGQLYAYRVDGPYQPNDGHRFNFNRLLLDPFATAISPLPDWDFGPARGYDLSGPDGDSVCSRGDDAGFMPKCVFTQEHFHWRDARPPRHPWSKTISYETPVRGFTIHLTSQVRHPGTYRGLIEKILFFQDLGVTTLELIPDAGIQCTPGDRHQSALWPTTDIYAKSGKGPESSINFVACHHGFTLHDLVSCRQKHNESNRQNNPDGASENFSEHYGDKGVTTDPRIESVRKRQIKNFLFSGEGPWAPLRESPGTGHQSGAIRARRHARRCRLCQPGSTRDKNVVWRT
jgi:pullulanase/glycogen debranching enzyme